MFPTIDSPCSKCCLLHHSKSMMKWTQSRIQPRKPKACPGRKPNRSNLKPSLTRNGASRSSSAIRLSSSISILSTIFMDLSIARSRGSAHSKSIWDRSCRRNSSFSCCHIVRMRRVAMRSALMLLWKSITMKPSVICRIAWSQFFWTLVLIVVWQVVRRLITQNKLRSLIRFLSWDCFIIGNWISIRIFGSGRRRKMMGKWVKKTIRYRKVLEGSPIKIKSSSTYPPATKSSMKILLKEYGNFSAISMSKNDPTNK